jgi:hypothetical protein
MRRDTIVSNHLLLGIAVYYQLWSGYRNDNIWTGIPVLLLGQILKNV